MNSVVIGAGRHVLPHLRHRHGGGLSFDGQGERQHAAQHEQRHVASERDVKGMRIGGEILASPERAVKHAADHGDAERRADLEGRDDDSRGEAGVTLIDARR